MRASRNSTFDEHLVASEIAFLPINGSHSHILCMEGYQWVVWLIHSNHISSIGRKLLEGKCDGRCRSLATAMQRGAA